MILPNSAMSPPDCLKSWGMRFRPYPAGTRRWNTSRKIKPQQKAILVSGFSETDRAKDAQRLGAGAYVKKPYIIEKIGVAIRDELAR